MSAQRERRLVLQWVECLLVPGVDRNTFIGAAQVLSQTHYSDVVEERIISNLCGYALCSNSLENQPRQKYHISLAQKKVFDLTERKKFCSSQCYRASKYAAAQFSTLPVSAREGKQVSIELLPAASEQSLSESIPDRAKEESTGARGIQQITKELLSVNVSIKENPVIVSDAPGEVDVAELGLPLSQTTLTTPRTLTLPKLSAVGRLLHAMSSWCTPSTWELLRRRESKEGGEGKEEQKEEVVEGEEEEGKEECDGGKNVGKKQEGGGYYRRVEEGTAEKGMGGDERNSRTSRSNNDTESLPRQKREGSNFPGSVAGVSVTERVAGGSSGYLPAIHSLSQTQLQIGIFLQQLKRNLPGVTAKLQLNIREISPAIHSLVGTFSFSRHTITFKPAEWRVIILILIQVFYPEWSLLKTHSDTVQHWARAISAVDTDLLLMLDAFKPSL